MTELVRLILDLLRSVWGWVVLFSPVKVAVIEDGERGSRKFAGRFFGETLTPGFYWATTLQTIESGVAIACEASPDGAVETFTKEGVPVWVWGVAVYDVEDFAANARIADSETLATQLLEAATVDVFSRRALSAAVGSPLPLRNSIKTALQKRADARKLGIRVRSAEVTGRKVLDPAVVRALALPTIETLINEGGLISADATLIVAGAIPTITRTD